jgi:Holliday junction resolvase RusA-like endonuclease
MGVKLGRKARKPEVVLLPPGTVLLETMILLRAVPWSASQVTRNGTFKAKRLVAWQRVIGVVAFRDRTQAAPYGGPVEVMVMAQFAKGPLPDATNVLKAVEDAIQGVVIVNDSQVVRNSCGRTKGEWDEVVVVVRTI